MMTSFFCDARSFVSAARTRTGIRRSGLAEMPQDQNQRGGIVVHDGGGFRAAKQREVVLQVSRAAASRAAREAVFEIVVIRRRSCTRFR